MNIGILGMYMYLPIFALIVGLGFVFFANDVFRYECQDPANWESAECKPPICKAAGVCTEDLIKFEPATIEEKVAEEVIINEDVPVADLPVEENTTNENSSEITDYFNQTCNCKEEENSVQ